jgi:hypothetical protein
MHRHTLKGSVIVDEVASWESGDDLPEINVTPNSVTLPPGSTYAINDVFTTTVPEQIIRAIITANGRRYVAVYRALVNATRFTGMY